VSAADTIRSCAHPDVVIAVDVLGFTRYDL